MSGSHNSVIVVNNLNEAQTALATVTNAGLDDIEKDQVTLVLPIYDETGSLRKYRAEMELADKELVEALINSRAGDEMLMSKWLFNTSFKVLNGFIPLADVTPLSGVYQPDGYTALYDVVYTALTDPNAGVVAYAESLRASGITVKVVVVVFTDGEDNSSRTNPDKIKTIVDELLRQENYLFSVVSFGAGYAKTAAAAMGFPNALECNATPHEIREVIAGTVSKSIIRASQTTIASNNFFA